VNAVTLGVISDTHMPRFGKALPAALRDGFARERVDIIVHCGDIVDAIAIPWFEAVAPFEAVAGNNDSRELVRRFGHKRILEFGAVRIGVTHGHEGTGRSTLARAENMFKDGRVNAVLFGHSHVPYCEWHGGVLYFNPGSPTDKRRQPNYSYGIIRIAKDTLEPRLVFYSDKSP
jgi:putative phosphoesterase